MWVKMTVSHLIPTVGVSTAKVHNNKVRRLECVNCKLSKHSHTQKYNLHWSLNLYINKLEKNKGTQYSKISQIKEYERCWITQNRVYTK